MFRLYIPKPSTDWTITPYYTSFLFTLVATPHTLTTGYIMYCIVFCFFCFFFLVLRFNSLPHQIKMMRYMVFCNILLCWFSPMVALVWKSKTCSYCEQKDCVYQWNCVDSVTKVFGFILGNTAGCHTPRLLCRLFSSSTFLWPSSLTRTQGLHILRAWDHTQTHHTR